MNKGDIIVALSAALNAFAVGMYLWDGLPVKAFYFSGALIICLALILMRG